MGLYACFAQNVATISLKLTDGSVSWHSFYLQYSLVPRRFLIEKTGLIQAICRDHSQIEQGCLGRTQRKREAPGRKSPISGHFRPISGHCPI